MESKFNMIISKRSGAKDMLQHETDHPPYPVYYIIYLEGGHKLYFDKDHYKEVSKMVDNALDKRIPSILKFKYVDVVYTIPVDRIVYTEAFVEFDQ